MRLWRYIVKILICLRALGKIWCFILIQNTKRSYLRGWLVRYIICSIMRSKAITFWPRQTKNWSNVWMQLYCIWMTRSNLIIKRMFFWIFWSLERRMLISLKLFQKKTLGCKEKCLTLLLRIWTIKLESLLTWLGTVEVKRKCWPL